MRLTPGTHRPWPSSNPAGRIFYIGLSGTASHIDTRTLAVKDVTAVGIL